MTEKFYCSQCGSDDIQIKMWVNPNIQQIKDTCNDENEGWCDTCEEHVSVVTIETLWENLADITINKDGKIEESFLHFKTGTDRQEIWHWFDERLPDGLDKWLEADLEKEKTRNRNIELLTELFPLVDKDLIECFSKNHWNDDGDDESNIEDFKCAIEHGDDDTEIRRCDHCNKPMMAGYYLSGEYACSDKCCLALYNGNKAAMEEELSHAEEDDAECYWTEWETFYTD